ncbi:MAG: 4-hydroxy-tetrahydrodipicolinate synthase [Bacteroidota bacterium]|nr:4-hydroxy-tetrahydrodipicolinate synthase [Bacteroidota bacterium]MEC8248051.1 4-hydroxy-tetrahydrodipicolinate synthase [Bacteroidota bacterium]MEC8723920.1 4-hydroxy-tetrahydrodipicolinate synthase [Bacteroidota bacterium]MEC8829608.1 4-hydroxy-tetrahydrodipicolinate synthase [Bacteroidota bacterium]
MDALIGMGVALVTPFKKDGSVDHKALSNIVEFNIANGTDYLVISGTTGESATLTKKEKAAIIQTISNSNAGRLPMVIGIGGNNTAAVVEELENTDLSLFVAVLSVAPYYNKPTQEGLYQHFKAVAKACPIPVILYNVPGRTSKNMEPITSLRLANDVENIVAIKEAGNNPDQYRELIRKKPDDFLVISGDDDLVLDVILEGGSGVISVIGQALVSDFSKMIQMGLKGDSDAAKTIEKRVMPLIELIFEENNPAGIKAVLNHMQLCEDFVRLPLVVATNTLKSKIAAAILEMKSQ